jgi:hypothetical protein
MEAADLLEGIRQRLLAMAEDPPYRFRNTRREDAEQYQQQSRTFEGYSESEVSRAEERLGVRFPAVFRAFLLRMGKAPGELFGGSDLAPLRKLDSFRARARRFLERHGAGPLPEDAVVILAHQGYTFLFLLANGGFDSPVFQYLEEDPAPKQIAAGFAALLEGELQQLEANHRERHRRGGYWLWLWPGGGVSEEHPALNSGERPVDHPHEFVD